MSAASHFFPEWASSPGETISDAMVERRIDQAHVAQMLQMDVVAFDQLLKGELPLSVAVARHLASVFGTSTEFWIRRETQYREQLARRHAAASEEARQWLLELPVADMVKFGWIERQDNSVQSTTLACQRYFGVPSVKSWRVEYGECLKQAVFRTSATFTSSPGAVAAWLRQGELVAEEIACGAWDPDGFQAEVPNLRALTRLPSPSQFTPELQRRCAQFGVAVAVVRAPQGCRASGACLMIRTDKALLMLSFRYLSDDHFWFTFFHEVGHLLLHRESGIHLEGDGATDARQEAEANHFAQEALVTQRHWDAMLRLPREAREIIRFATRIGVSPGIVVGQLQHQGRFSQHQMNTLKRRFTWDSSP